MSRHLVILVASAVVALAGIAVVSATLMPGALHRGDRTQPQTSTMNTASQKTFGNSTAFVDVNDSPVSFPSERTIQPPRTGNAGLVSADGSPLMSAFVFLNVALALIATARLATRTQTRGA